MVLDGCGGFSFSACAVDGRGAPAGARRACPGRGFVLSFGDWTFAGVDSLSLLNLASASMHRASAVFIRLVTWDSGKNFGLWSVR